MHSSIPCWCYYVLWSIFYQSTTCLQLPICREVICPLVEGCSGPLLPDSWHLSNFHLHTITPAPQFSHYNRLSFQNVSRIRFVGLRINTTIQNRMTYEQKIFIELIWRVPSHPYIVWTGPAASNRLFCFILLKLLSGKKLGEVWQASKTGQVMHAPFFPRRIVRGRSKRNKMLCIMPLATYNGLHTLL